MNSSTPAIPIPIESLVPLVRDAHTVDRSGVAAAACLVYDIIICWDQEVEYIWKSAWTPPKLLYLFARYFSLICKHGCCHDWTIFEGVAGQLIIMGVEISLMLRVYALFRRDKRILALLSFLYFGMFSFLLAMVVSTLVTHLLMYPTAEVTAISVILGLALNEIISVAPLRGIFPPDFPLSGCFPVYVPGFFSFYWIPSLIFESILFILMTINFVRYVREQKTPMPLITQFFRDGTVYYAVIFATLLINVLLYQLVNSALAQVAIGWELTAFSIAGSRLILNLRVMGYATRSPAGTAEVATLEVMRFDNPSPELLSRYSRTQTQEQTQTSSFASSEPGSPSAGAFNAPERGRATESEGSLDTDVRRDWISEWESV
ncbi:hypothetical protein M0805_004626 [Coniferiporia weirii]|nr:hypothetical protein M0805_004626 [Coniferiporia weirii]